MKFSFLAGCLIIHLQSISQNSDLNIFRITSSHTSFPDTARAAGHIYNKVLYDVATHYMDSSVLIAVPKNFDAGKKVDMIFWFHGWSNNIDSASVRFHLLDQFAASLSNSIFVLAETTKNAPDSYGGKLEYDNTFKELVADIEEKLKKEKIIPGKTETGNIILAGHSGAYRVMAYILQKGNVPVQEVILFDALYGQTDKYLDWIHLDSSYRFIDIYTNGGGTDGESKEMLKQLIQSNVSVDTIEEKDLNSQLLQKQKILFIHSLHEHNDIINAPDNLQLFLENSPFLKRLRGR